MLGTDDGRRPPSRRTALGAAWAVPAVMIAVATPAHASSGPIGGGDQFSLEILGFVVSVLDPARDQEFSPDQEARSRRGRPLPGDDFRVSITVANPTGTTIPPRSAPVTVTFPADVAGAPRHVSDHGGPGSDRWQWSYDVAGVVTAVYKPALGAHGQAVPLVLEFTRPASSGGWAAPDGSNDADISVSAGSGAAVDTETRRIQFPTPVTTIRVSQSDVAPAVGDDFLWPVTVENIGQGPLPAGFVLEFRDAYFSWQGVESSVSSGFESDGWSLTLDLPGPDGTDGFGVVVYSITRTTPLAAGETSSIGVPLRATVPGSFEATAQPALENEAAVRFEAEPQAARASTV